MKGQLIFSVLQSAMFLDVPRLKIIAIVPLLTFRYTDGLIHSPSLPQ